MAATGVQCSYTVAHYSNATLVRRTDIALSAGHAVHAVSVAFLPSPPPPPPPPGTLRRASARRRSWRSSFAVGVRRERSSSHHHRARAHKRPFQRGAWIGLCHHHTPLCHRDNKTRRKRVHTLCNNVTPFLIKALPPTTSPNKPSVRIIRKSHVFGSASGGAVYTCCRHPPRAFLVRDR